jgi:hypothetical protein
MLSSADVSFTLYIIRYLCKYVLCLYLRLMLMLSYVKIKRRTHFNINKTFSLSALSSLQRGKSFHSIKALLIPPQFLYCKVQLDSALYTRSFKSIHVNLHFFIVCKVCFSGLWTEIRAKNQWSRNTFAEGFDVDTQRRVLSHATVTACIEGGIQAQRGGGMSCEECEITVDEEKGTQPLLLF